MLRRIKERRWSREGGGGGGRGGGGGGGGGGNAEANLGQEEHFGSGGPGDFPASRTPQPSHHAQQR